MHTSDIELPRFADYQPTHFDAKGLGSDGQEDWLVLPLCHKPKIATLLDNSNWEMAVESIERVSNRVQRARRHVAYLLSCHADGPFILDRDVSDFAFQIGKCRPHAEKRLFDLIDMQPVDGEMLDSFAARLDTAIESGPDYEIHYFGHWATDFEIIIVRPGSAAHRKAQSIVAALSDYPVLDESDFSEREHEASLENIKEVIRQIENDVDSNSDIDLGFDEHASEVFSWLWDNEQSEVECHDGGGAYPSRESVERAIVALGYLEFDVDAKA